MRPQGAQGGRGPHAATRVGEAANPGPPTRSRRILGDGPTVWCCNVNGLNDNPHKWDRVTGPAVEAKANIVVLS